MRKVAFSKYSGAGNDFILIDNRELFFPYTQVSSLCSRTDGIGADGVILLEHGNKVRYKMRIFNADGSEAEMCGNGLRAFTHFLSQFSIQERYEIENITGNIYETSALADSVKVVMPSATDFKENILCPLVNETLNVSYINTGVPHVVILVDDINNVDVLEKGKEIRNHPLFQPKGTNVNFVSLGEGCINVRTYERGVEGETLACGTGSAASAIIASQHFNLKPPIDVKVRSGALLKVNFQSPTSPITMEGVAKKVFEGSFLI